MRTPMAWGAILLGLAGSADAAVFEWRYDAVLPLIHDEGDRGPSPETERIIGRVVLDVPDPFDLSISCQVPTIFDRAGTCDELVVASVGFATTDFNVSEQTLTFVTDGAGRVEDVDLSIIGDPESGVLGLDSLFFDLRGGPSYAGGGGEWVLTNPPPVPVPLPGTVPLVLMALASLAWASRRTGRGRAA